VRAGIERTDAMSESPRDAPPVVEYYGMSSECLLRIARFVVGLVGLILALLLSSVLLCDAWNFIHRMATNLQRPMTHCDALHLIACLIVLSCYFIMYRIAYEECELRAREVALPAMRSVWQLPE
jgi:hypothetical protein